MHGAELIDGLELVAAASNDGVIRPRDGVSGVVWLDLSKLALEVALLRVKTVVRLLAPSLLVDESTRLVIGGDGACPAASVADAAVRAIQDPLSGQLRLATIRGEQVLDRLEEFVRSGVDFVHASSGKLLDLRLSPTVGRCDPPAAVLAKAMNQGADIVISAGASRASASAALEADVPDLAEVEVAYHFEAGGDATVALVGGVDAEPLAAFRRSALADSVDVAVDEHEGVSLLKLSSPALPALRRVARRGDMCFDGLPTSIERFVKARADVYLGRVPRDLFEFASDVRPLDEWLDT